MKHYLGDPIHIDAHGRTATTDKSGHVADMIRSVLFTRPGERVNRPDYGCGLGALVFEPNDPDLAGTVRFTVMSALQRWLGGAITVLELRVRATDSTLSITVQYLRLDTGTVELGTFNTTGVTP